MLKEPGDMARITMQVDIDARRIATQVATYFDGLEDYVESLVKEEMNGFNIEEIIQARVKSTMQEAVEYQVRQRINHLLNVKYRDKIDDLVQEIIDEDKFT